MNHIAATPPSPTLRLDKWLWFARVVRTRSQATRLCAEGGVSVGGRGAAKAHHPVRIGDLITIDLSQHRRRLTVLRLGERRGPPAAARLLYDEPVPPLIRREAAPAWTSLFADEDEAEFLDAQRLTQSL